jgi:hypothetical protein
MSSPPQIPAASLSRGLASPNSEPAQTLTVVQSLHDLHQRLDKLAQRLEQFAPVKTRQPDEGKND